MLHACNQRIAPSRPAVYVIDDDPSSARSSCYLLRALDMECRQFASGPAFLRSLPQLAPGCILLDLLMPAMDGVQLQRELRRRGVCWPVIFMSGHEGARRLLRQLSSEPLALLAKPYSDEQMLEALHRGFVELQAAQLPA